MVPKRYRIQSISFDTHDTFTFVLKPLEEGIPSFLPGQFCMLYLFGFGEIPISISGNSSQKEVLVHTIRAVGLLTQAMSRLKEGDEYRDWETDRKSTRLNSSHLKLSRMPSSA